MNKKSSRVSFRCLLIGVLLIPVNCYWILQLEMVSDLGHPTRISLFFNVIFILFVLTLLNIILKRLLPKAALTQSELLVIYVMLCLASALSSTDMMQVLMPVMTYAFRFATPENEWASLFHRYIPKWLTISDNKALKGYYEGNSYFFQYLWTWVTPIIAWSAFIFVLLFIMLCICVILKKQWTEREKLSYPIIQLPLEMTHTGGVKSFFKNNLLWIGFAIAGGIDIINGLHYLYPAIPGIFIRYDIGKLFTDKPWNAIGWLPIFSYPFVIGYCFLIPLDLLFSCWFFYLFWKAEVVMVDAMGWKSLPAFAAGLDHRQELTGVWIGLCIFALLGLRRHLVMVFKHTFSIKQWANPSKLDDSTEPMQYKTALIGAVGGVIFLMFFSYKAGMSLWVAAFFFAIYFALSLTITRIRAELGPPAHGFHHRGPDQMIPELAGTRRVGTSNLTVISLFYWFNYAYRSHPMAHQLEGFKIAERTGMNNRKLGAAMLLATVVGILTTFYIHLHITYKLGASVRITGHSIQWGRETYTRLQGWLYNPVGTDYTSAGLMGAGLIFAVFLMLMRRKFFWWPFHPVGLAVTGSWSTNRIWFSVFLAWLAKWLILKCGGLKAYRRAIQFFIGLILGEYVVGSLWSIIGIALDRRTFVFWMQ